MSVISLVLCSDAMTGKGIDQILEHPGDTTLYEPWVGSAVRYVHPPSRETAHFLAESSTLHLG
jgi:poly-gamma-glutamate synthesis protein (capsule biosynthesis protein)